jgi:predicted transcriptional regulator
MAKRVFFSNQVYYNILVELSKKENYALRLARNINTPFSNISEHMPQLITMHLVEIKPTEDGRIRLYHLTKKGIKVLEHLNKIVEIEDELIA